MNNLINVASDLIKSHHQIIITLIYLNRFITFGNITITSVGVSKMNAVARAQLLFQMITFLKNIYIARASVQKHGTANVWPWQLKWLEHSAWIRRLGVRVPFRSRHFLSQKRRHFRENIRWCVENEWSCPSTFNISNVDFISKIFMTFGNNNMDKPAIEFNQCCFWYNF